MSNEKPKPPDNKDKTATDCSPKPKDETTKKND
jgi:hypothetical protein